MGKKHGGTGKPLFLDETGNMSIDTGWWKRTRWIMLTPREQFVLMWLNLDTSRCADAEAVRKWERQLCGSRTTAWRARKRLAEKGAI